jgi:hypothetical protein
MVIASAVVVGEWMALTRLDAVGSVRFAEMGGAVLVVGVAGALGILIVSWIRYPLAPTIVLLAAGAGQLALQARQDNSAASWLSAWPSVPRIQASSELLYQPAGRRLTYLIALLAMVGALSVLRHRRDLRVITVVGGTVVLTVTLAAWTVSNPPPALTRSAQRLVDDPAGAQVCVAATAADACAFSTYLSWAHQWASLSDEMLSPVAEALGGHRLTIRQRFQVGAQSVAQIDEVSAPIQRVLASPATVRSGSDELTVGTVWVRRGESSDDLLHLSMGVASWAVGMPRGSTTCSAMGQARSAVALSLVEHAGGTVRRAVAEVSSGGTLYLGNVGVTAREIAYGRLLATKDVNRRLTAVWERAIDPSTTLDQLGSLLGIPVPAPTAESEAGADVLRLEPPCR